MCWRQKEEPFLHEAVIHNDLENVRVLGRSQQLKQLRNWLGFDAVELAHYLGRDECSALLQPQPPRTFKAMLKGTKSAQKLSLQEFQEYFKVTYSPSLRFSDYATFQHVIKNCPWILRSSSLGEENREWGKEYSSKIAEGYVIPGVIQWVNDTFGYGFFTEEPLSEGTLIGEYTGLVRQLHRFHPDTTAYCFHYPTRFWSWNYYMVDALHVGNELRFINHSEEPNLHPICAVDRGLLHLLFRTNRAVEAGEQLLLNYGKDYWKRRKKV